MSLMAITRSSSYTIDAGMSPLMILQNRQLSIVGSTLEVTLSCGPLHDGRSRDGRRLYPVFPYPHYTRMPREDVDALYAWLRTRPAVQRPTPPHRLRFPYDRQWALAVWRALYFRPGAPPVDTTHDAQWQRGAYLVEGPAHCMASHAGRNALGASQSGPLAGGGLLAGEGWYAPSLHRADEAGVADWPVDDIVALLKTGAAPRGQVQGPMADVVFHGTQHLETTDLTAMAVYLKSLPQDRRPVPAAPPAPPAVRDLGAKLDRQHCADCHGDQGQGGTAGRYPALAGNRLVTMAAPDNLIRSVLEGGFGPSTAGRPMPFGMPPFAQTLDDASLAALLSYLRSAWGHEAGAVSALDVLQRR
jgi:mono/diheme cytochrome c family protein